MNNLIVFATYWNAIDWIEPSLKQIDIIDPKEIIICDGCFDHKFPVHSTDGTREKIEAFVSERSHARLISPVRVSKIEGMIRTWLGSNKLAWWKRFTPARIKAVLRAGLCHHYRINQALTFNKMISLSSRWKPGCWFMNYDCDQFYSEDVLEGFKTIKGSNEVGLLTASELTFFQDKDSYTDQYEKRNFNNMPHKIYSNTNIVTTRDIVREDFLGFKHYWKSEKTKHLGKYCHYKFQNNKRFDLGYQVGNRKMPDTSKYEFCKFTDDHPRVVRDILS